MSARWKPVDGELLVLAVAGPGKETVDHAVERHVGVGQRVRRPSLAKVAGKAL